MIKKNDLVNIMNALMLKHWGIISIDEKYVEVLKEKDLFHAENSILNRIDNPGKIDNKEVEITIVAIAIPYAINGYEKPVGFNWGKIDAFAWDFDYHVVLKKMLNQIKKDIEKIAGMSLDAVEYCVDNSPYNDREVAFYAGLGQVGFDHLLINDELGSNFFIGYLIIPHHLDIEKAALTFPEDLPSQIEHPFCKTCNVCTVHCPSNVCEARPVDMNKCLSALTQTKEWISEEQRLKFGNRLYGCNVCQTVCPLNQNSRPHARVMLTTSNWIEAIEILNSTQNQFKEKYGHMGFAWRSFWIYKRNALIVLGNVGDAKALEFLKENPKFLKDEKLSEYYKWTINRIENRNSKEFDTNKAQAY